MARKQFKITEEKIKKLIAEGRGQGEGAAYQPWLQIGNFSSTGRGSRIRDHRTGRIHHLFSELETRYYYILAWSEKVLDIREQFPLLPLSETEEIAAALGYKHPRAPGGACDEVMTTDFLLTVRGSDSDPVPHLEARYVKYEKDMDNKRTCEKLQIERAFWTAHDVTFKVVTEKSIDLVKSKNIEKVLGYYELPAIDKTDEELAACSEALLKRLAEDVYQPLDACAGYIDRVFRLESGDALNLFFHLSARKVIPLRMTEKLLPTQPVRQIVDVEKLEARLAQGEGKFYADQA